MKKAFLILMLLAVSVGLIAQDGPTKTFSFAPTVNILFMPFQMVSRPTAAPGVTWDAKGEDGYEKYDPSTGLGIALARAAGNAQGVSMQVGLSGTYGSNFGFGLNFRIVGAAASGQGTFEMNSWELPHFWWQPMDGLRIRVGNGTSGFGAGLANSAWGSDWALGLPEFRRAGLDGDGVSVRYITGDVTVELSVPGISRFGGGQIVAQPGNPGLGNAFNFANGENDIAYRLMRTQLGFGFNIAGIGYVSLSYLGPNGAAPGGFTIADKDSANPGRITAYDGRPVNTNDIGAAPRFNFGFRLSAVDGLTVDLAGRFALAVTPKSILSYHDYIYKADGTWDNVFGWLGYNETKENWTLKAPFNLGVGVTYAISSDISVTARADMSFGGSLKIDEGGVTTAGSIFAKGNEILFPTNMWTKLFGTVRLPDVNNITIGFEFGLQNFGAITVKPATGDEFNYYRTDPDRPMVAENKDNAETSGFNGGMRLGGGAYVQIPVVQAGNIRIGAFFRSGTVHGQKEDTVFSLPISWNIGW